MFASRGPTGPPVGIGDYALALRLTQGQEFACQLPPRWLDERSLLPTWLQVGPRSNGRGCPRYTDQRRDNSGANPS